MNAGCITTQWTNNQDGNANGIWTLTNCNNGGNDYQDVWFRITGTGNPIGVNIFSMNAPDARVVVYQGCPTTLNANTLWIACTTITGALGGLNFNSLSGTEYYIQIQRRSGNNNNQNGSICVYNYTLSPCGNPNALLNDFCENAATLTYGLGTSFSASTAGTFTPDHANTLDGYGGGPGAGPFCGNIHNNSWYKFIAGNTTETFQFTQTSCSGVQAHVYEIIMNAGCCSTFTPVGNCLLNIPSPPGASSVVTATNLTVGNQYVLMIDGYLGAECNFTIADWGAINVLPVELSDFQGVEFKDKNVLMWVTDSESNNDYFELLKSYNGDQFEVIGTVKGVGNSTQKNSYGFEDYDVRIGVAYYKLRQFDFDGKSTSSQIIALNRNSSQNGLVNVYPNPTESAITIDIQTATHEGGMVVIEGVNGALIHQQFIEGKGIHQVNLDMSSMLSGLYFVRYIDAETTSVKSFLKK